MFLIILRHRKCVTRQRATTQQHFFFVPDRFKTQKMCNEAVCMVPYNLELVRAHLKMQEMCNKAVHRELYTLRYVTDHLKTQEMYKRVAEKSFLTI